MQMYVNYFDHFVKLTEEHPTIGIVLCKKKHDPLVEITLPQVAYIHASEYKLYMPDKELLRRKLERSRAEVERAVGGWENEQAASPYAPLRRIEKNQRGNREPTAELLAFRGKVNSLYWIDSGFDIRKLSGSLPCL